MTLKNLIMCCNEIYQLVEITTQTDEWDYEHDGGFKVITLNKGYVYQIVEDCINEMNYKGELPENSIYNDEVQWYRIEQNRVLYIRIY